MMLSGGSDEGPMMTRVDAIAHVLALASSVDGEYGTTGDPHPTRLDTVTALYALGVSGLELKAADEANGWKR